MVLYVTLLFVEMRSRASDNITLIFNTIVKLAIYHGGSFHCNDLTDDGGDPPVHEETAIRC